MPISHRPVANLGVVAAQKRSTDFMCGGTSGKWRRGTLDKPDAKGTGKPLNFFALNVTMNNKNRGSGDDSCAKCGKWMFSYVSFLRNIYFII